MPTAFGGQSQQRWGDNTINTNEYIRDLMLTDLNGRPTGTADARRKGMLVLAFFKADGPASQQTLPCLQRLADAYKESGKLTVIGVSQDDGETARAVADQQGLKFPILVDYDLYHSMIYGLTAVPAVFLADGSGRVLKKVVGFRPEALDDISARVAQFAEVEPVAVAGSNPASTT
jgi:peroxiredoxin